MEALASRKRYKYEYLGYKDSPHTCKLVVNGVSYADVKIRDKEVLAGLFLLLLYSAASAESESVKVFIVRRRGGKDFNGISRLTLKL